MIGSLLTDELLEKGYQVSHLGRKAGKDKRVKTYLWNVDKQEIDPDCVTGVDLIIHLAGANVSGKRWTEKRKKILIDSRTKSIRLIYDLLKVKEHQVKRVVSASATGYYGDSGDELMTEGSAPGSDFLATCCVEWENAVDEGAAHGLGILKFRTGVVLLKQGGALPVMAAPVKLGLGLPLGSGSQWVPWIHGRDVISMYLFGVENDELTGVYNMVSPEPATNKQLTQAIARQLKKPLWLPNVPALVLKLVLGEMSLIVLGSTKAYSAKIELAGFKFKYPVLADALKDIYG